MVEYEDADALLLLVVATRSFSDARSKLWDRWVAVRKTASVPTRPHVQDIHCRIKIFTAAAAKRRYFISIGLPAGLVRRKVRTPGLLERCS